MSIYANYCQTIEQTVLANQNLSSFKSHPAYRQILEHVSPQFGQQYATALQPKLSENCIRTFCNLNDQWGSPVKAQCGPYHCSPTSLRYLLHAYLILDHIKQLGIQTCPIVELGGGYGGLCLALYHLQELFGISISKYTIIDLPAPTGLQRLYLSQFNIPVETQLAETYGNTIVPDPNLFLIANYSFSELEASHRDQYSIQLLPKIAHGFMAWNAIPLYHFGARLLRQELEYPLTSMQGYNYYLYW